MKLIAMEYVYEGTFGLKLRREWFASKEAAEKRYRELKREKHKSQKELRQPVIGQVHFGVSRLSLVRFLNELEKSTPFDDNKNTADAPPDTTEHPAPSHDSNAPLGLPNR